jgi:hypothetical protein
MSPLYVNDMYVLYWERLITCFLILRLPCMSGVILCFVCLQSRLTGILLTKHFTLGNPLRHVSCSVPLWPNTLHHILSSASTFYCRACLLQCLSTKARSQTWQSLSYLFQTLEVLRVRINLTRICLLKMSELPLTMTWTMLSQKQAASHGRIKEMLLSNLS